MRTASHRQWAEYRARVAELIAAGQNEGTARLVASEEKAARKAARAAELAAEKAAHVKRALHCQICGRAILAYTGLIAHHGYTRPGDGWQTASCHGARELPYENDSAVLAAYVPTLLGAAESCAADVVALKAEARPVRYEFTEWNRQRGRREDRHLMVTRDTFESVVGNNPVAFADWKSHAVRPTFDSTLESAIARTQMREKMFRDMHREQKARLDAWKRTRVWESGVWKPYKGNPA